VRCGEALLETKKKDQEEIHGETEKKTDYGKGLLEAHA
jgi:hypothetical protein